MSERVLAEWEDQRVVVHALSPESGAPSGLTHRPTGRIGSDGFIYEPRTESGDQLSRLQFYPWHAVRLIEKLEPPE